VAGRTAAARRARRRYLTLPAETTRPAPGYPSPAEPGPGARPERDFLEGTMNLRALVAEAVGTFILVGMGSMGLASAFLSAGQNAPLWVPLIVPFAFGLGLLAAIAFVGHVSGGHFNPAVTLGFLLDRRIDWLTALGYVIAQVLGAIAASLTILLMLSRDFVGVTRTVPGLTSDDPFAAELHAFGAEIVLTAIFVGVILSITRKAPNQAVFVISLTLVAIHFAGIPISGASVNPARSLAPAIVAGDYTSLWIYLTAPFAGSVIGWALYWFLAPQDEEVMAEEEVEFDEDEFDDADEDDEDDEG
jgi:aquaporin Z